jgi:type VI secretion system protein ImpL
VKHILSLPGSRIFLWFIIILVLAGVLCLCWLVWREPGALGFEVGTTTHDHWQTGLFVATGLGFLIFVLLFLQSRFGGGNNFDLHLAHAASDEEKKSVSKPQPVVSHSRKLTREMRDHLRAVYTFFWRAKVRLLLVVGDDADVDALVPELRAHGWAEGHGTVLIAGGDLKAEPDTARLDALRRLARRRPLDGIVWVTRESDYPGAAWMDYGLRHLQQVGARLRWHAPLYLWQLSKTGAGQAAQPARGRVLPGAGH